MTRKNKTDELERLRLENEILWERKGDERKILETVARLRKELFDERMERANHWVHAGRMILWITDKKRKPAVTAFTEGPERRVAYAIEERYGK